MEVSGAARFCRRCGAPQQARATQFETIAAGMSDRTVRILCYIPFFGFIPAIIVLMAHRYRSNLGMRFDAFQSLYLFLAGLVLDSVGPIVRSTGFPGLGWTHGMIDLLKLLLMIGWIYLLVKASQNRQVRMPVIGDLAARSTYEQL
jgi:uncharacterized membrane protein